MLSTGCNIVGSESIELNADRRGSRCREYTAERSCSPEGVELVREDMGQNMEGDD